jgi:PAS domain S-box-containing protein/diguanylate cyclase (GGDEF)-like protein
MTNSEPIAAQDQRPAGPVPLRILILEDVAEDFEICVANLRQAKLNFQAIQAVSREDFQSLLENSEYDLIISDYRLQEWNGMDAFETLRGSHKDVPFLLFTGALGEEKAVECMKKGVADFVLKNRADALPGAVVRAVEQTRVRQERFEAVNALMESEKKFRVLADSIASAVLAYQGTKCEYANRAAENLTGYSGKELLSLSFWTLVHPNSHSVLVKHGFSRLLEGSGTARYELDILTKHGEVRTWDATLGRIAINGQPAGLITAMDITKRPHLETAPEESSIRDRATGLYNAEQLQIAVRSEIKRSERNGRSFSLLLIKLGQSMEDHNGEKIHPAERSRAQCRLANLIGEVCRTGDTAFLHSGEEFVVLLPETPMAGVRKLSLRLGERLSTEQNSAALDVVGGLAVFPQDGPTFEHLIRATKRTIRKIGIKRAVQPAALS